MTRFKNLVKVSAALDITLSQLLGGVEKKAKQLANTSSVVVKRAQGKR
jgi:hypothetical protein